MLRHSARVLSTAISPSMEFCLHGALQSSGTSLPVPLERIFGQHDVRAEAGAPKHLRICELLTSRVVGSRWIYRGSGTGMRVECRHEFCGRVMA